MLIISFFILLVLMLFKSVYTVLLVFAVLIYLFRLKSKDCFILAFLFVLSTVTIGFLFNKFAFANIASIYVYYLLIFGVLLGLLETLGYNRDRN